jgi:O-antigen/teichoic acid export membrane protein
VKQRYTKDVLLFAAGRGLVGLVFLGYLATSAHLLAKEDFSLFQSLMGLHGIVMMIGLPLNISAMHLVAAAADTHRRATLGAVLRLAFICALIVAGTLLVLTPFLTARLHAQTVRPVLCLAALAPVNILLVVFHGGLQGRNRYGAFSSARIVEAAIGCSAGVALMLAGMRVAGALGGYLVGMTVLCFYFGARRDLYDTGGSTGAVRHEMRALIRPVLASGVLLVISNLPMLIARARLPPAAAADYATLFVLRYGVLVFAEAAAWPLYTRIVAGEEQPGMLQTALRLVALLGIAFIALGLLQPAILFRLVFGEAFATAAAHMTGYGVFMLLYMLAMVMLYYRAARGNLSSLAIVLPVIVIAGLFVIPDISPGRIIAAQSLASAVCLGAATLGGRRA